MLTKSDLMSFVQCPRKLWLEKNQLDVVRDPDPASERRMKEGLQAGEVSRELLRASSTSVLWPVAREDKQRAADDAMKLLDASPNLPAVEVPLYHDGVYARADAMLPDEGGGYILDETKAVTFPLATNKVDPGRPDLNLVLDAAIQMYLACSSGYLIGKVCLNLLDNQWKRPADGAMTGLFRKMDVTDLAVDMFTDIPSLIQQARDALAAPMPTCTTGKQCKSPHQCPFMTHCKTLDPPQEAHPIELLPDSAGKKLAKKLKDEHGYTSILHPSPGELVGNNAWLYQRIQEAHRTGQAFHDKESAKEFEKLPYPRYYFDFEGIDLAIPKWEGIRPYEQIPYQWSCHIETAPGVFEHREFLDLSGEDPSQFCVEAMLDTIDLEPNTPIFVFYKPYEDTRLKELAIRHPEHADAIEKLRNKLVDLLPIVKEYFYDPRMAGSFSIKKVLPCIAPDLDYSKLDDVQDGIGAQLAYIKVAIDKSVSEDERLTIDWNSRVYCRQDTWAMVEVAYFLELRGRPVRPETM